MSDNSNSNQSYLRERDVKDILQITRKFSKVESIGDFINSLFRDANKDIETFGKNDIFVPTVVDMYGVASGLYGVNWHRFFITLVDFCVENDADLNLYLKRRLVGTSGYDKLLQASCLNFLGLTLPLVSRQKMAVSSVGTACIYEGFDKKMTSVRMIFLSKKTIETFEDTSYSRQEYFKNMRSVFGTDGTFKQLAYGAKKCKEMATEPRFFELF